MWVRIAAHAQVWFEPRLLATYRVRRPGSLTGDAAQSTRLVRDMRLATDIIATYLRSYLPDDEARVALARARRVYAFWALEASADAAATGDVMGVLAHTREALACSRSALGDPQLDTHSRPRRNQERRSLAPGEAQLGAAGVGRFPNRGVIRPIKSHCGDRGARPVTCTGDRVAGSRPCWA